MINYRAEEFEFQWWDHAFNKAAKSVKVEADQDGQVKVGRHLLFNGHEYVTLVFFRLRKGCDLDSCFVYKSMTFR